MTMDVFQLRDAVIGDYEAFVKGFLNVRDPRIRGVIEETLADGLLWPEPWLSLNPRFKPGGTVDELVATGKLHEACARAFRMGKDLDPSGAGSLCPCINTRSKRSRLLVLATTTS